MSRHPAGSALLLCGWLGSLVWACSGGASTGGESDGAAAGDTTQGGPDGTSTDDATTGSDTAPTLDAPAGTDASTGSDAPSAVDGASGDGRSPADVQADAPPEATAGHDAGDAGATVDSSADASDAACDGPCPCPAGWSTCSGACVDMGTNLANCGACGVTCSGSCYGGRCATPVTTDGTRGFRLAISPTDAYWTDPSGSQVRTVPLSGGASRAIATGQVNPIGIAVDSTNVYWVDYSSVQSEPLAGASPVTVVSGYGGLDLGVLRSDIYWSDPGGNLLLKVSKSGGTVTTLATAPSSGGPPISLSGLALDATHVYWTLLASPGTVMRADLDGGSPMTIATDTTGAGASYQMAVDSSYAYWIDGASIMKAPIGGGPAVAIASEPTAIDIAADSSGVYWVTSQARVMHIGADGTPVTLAYAQGTDATCIALDANYVYWLDRDIVQPLMKVPK